MNSASNLPHVAVSVALLLLATSVASGQGFSPEEAVRRMTVPAGLEATLVAAEPLVRQPVCIEFDDRGRLWVIQYLQYPNPAELKRVQVDRFSRTKYDRVPEPPPRGPRGADRVTILEDADGDGRMDRSRDFVDGLNLATGLAFGHGGVFVLNVPYLLFYPDADRNDVPDGAPQVLLTGFGMEDAHSVANSLTWGPDGWLYGCQGSTVTANIRGIEFQQGVWRYHPVTKAFELFCEGGGNSWGLDFDAAGRLLYSTNWGGHVLLHGVPGGNFVKAFAKHGALHNPHAYGYFDHAPHESFRGGHVTVGGIVYQSDKLPVWLRGSYVAADLLGHAVYWHDIVPRGSTVKTKHGGELLVANDTWFAPTDVTTGPDGAIYVADWQDARTAHPDPDAEWDRTNGRIYRIAAKGTKPATTIEFSKLRVDELLELHANPNQWHVRRARQELVRRGERSLDSRLIESAVRGRNETASLEALWTLAATGAFDEPLGVKLLASPHEHVRAWTVRLLGDAREVSPAVAERLDELAEQEPSVTVRQSLACAAARLPAAHALPIINANINLDIDNDDPYVPLLWWWAVERHSVSGREEVLRRFVRPTLWKSRLGRDVLLPRLIRRYAAEGNDEGLNSVVRLLNAAPDAAARKELWPPVLTGLREAPSTTLAKRDVLAERVRQDWLTDAADLPLMQLGVLLRLHDPTTFALRTLSDTKSSASQRTSAIAALAETRDATLVERLLQVASSPSTPEPVRAAAVHALAKFDDARIAPALVALAGKSSPSLQTQIRGVLFARKDSARAWLLAVDRGEMRADSAPLEEVRAIALLGDSQLDALVTKHWGKLQAATREERLAEVRRLNNDLRAAPGDAIAGQATFKKHCASCHQLFGEGVKLGPDLTTANRRDREHLLLSLVDPSSVVRKEYLSFVVQTKDGRILTGLAAARDDAGVTLVNAKNEKTHLAAGEIEAVAESDKSLMPDDLHRQLTPQELRDLFAYLQTNLN